MKSKHITVKRKHFYITCCWSKTWTNQILDQMKSRCFPSCYDIVCGERLRVSLGYQSLHMRDIKASGDQVRKKIICHALCTDHWWSNLHRASSSRTNQITDGFRWVSSRHDETSNSNQMSDLQPAELHQRMRSNCSTNRNVIGTVLVGICRVSFL